MEREMILWLRLRANKFRENELSPTGDYLCIWNVDDLRTPDSIEVMAKALDENPDVDCDRNRTNTYKPLDLKSRPLKKCKTLS